VVNVVEREQVEVKLPKGWKWVELGSVCEQSRQTIIPKTSLAASLPYLSLEHIESTTGRILREPSEAIEDEGLSNTFAFDSQHVLYGKLRPYLNKVALPDFSGRCTTEAIPLAPKECIEREYLAWTLRRQETVDAAMQGKTGSRMPRANLTELFSLKIPLPPLPEQKRIVDLLTDRLSTIDKARTATEAQLEAARALPAAYLREVFDSPEAKKWERKKLGDLALSVQNGIYKSSEHYGQGHSFLRMYNVQNTSWNLNLNPLAKVLLNDQELEKFELKVGDLLVSRVNSFELVGKCSWVCKEAEGYVFENMLIRVCLIDSVDSLFIAQQMGHRSIRWQVQSVAKQAIGQASINSTDIRDLELLIPPLAEQTKLAVKLSERTEQARKLQQSLQSQLDTINKLPAALLRQAFNGEL
jgi:type I restriction enzyme, S subunit